MSYLDYPAYYPLASLVVLACLAVSLGQKPLIRTIRIITCLGLTGAAVLMYAKYIIPYDFKLYRIAGLDLFQGLNVYQPHPGPDSQRSPYPPSAWPLFELFALASLRKSARIWSVLNALGAFLLVPLAARALRAQDPTARLPPRPVLGLLSAAVALSNATCSSLALGQFSILCALSIFAALWAHGVSHPWLSGLFLTFATPKPATLLPFLLLFLRRKDAPVWLSLALSSSALILISGHAAEIPHLLDDNLRLIARMSSPGQVNDYSYAGESHFSLIGFDHTLYRLGLRDRPLIQLTSYLLLIALLISVARPVLKARLSRSASCSLLTLFTMLFLYHRIYDAVLLALPLVYCVGRALARHPSSPRYPLALSASAILAVLFAFPELYPPLERWAVTHRPFGSLIEALILPSSTWLVLSALVAFRLASHSASSLSTAPTRLANSSRPNRAAWLSPFSIRSAR